MGIIRHFFDSPVLEEVRFVTAQFFNLNKLIENLNDSY